MAGSNKLMKEITDQFLHCKICYEAYKMPKTLVCLHTFCTDCLQKHVDSDNGRSSRFLLYTRYITCPLCRSKTEIPTGGIRRLPDNFLVSSLTDVLDRRRTGKVPPCEICPGNRPRLNNCASHKCLDCAKLLCKSCVDLHMTTRVTQQHSLIDIEGEKDIECKTHPEEIVRYYCEPCEECICVVCTFQEHRDHEICSFNDGFSKYKSGLDGLLEQCKDRLVDVKDRVSVINKFETALKETRENIRDLAISYIAQVRATERQLMQKVEGEFGEKVQGFLQNKEWLVENQDALQTTCNLAEIIMNDRGIEMLLLKKELQSKLSALLEPAVPSVPEDFTHEIKFIPGDVKLGHISLNPEEEELNSDLKQKHSLDDSEKCDPPRKRMNSMKDAQTETSRVSSPVSGKIKFDFPDSSGAELQGTNVEIGSRDNEKMECKLVIAKTDVSVNTMCSMQDSKSTIFPEEPKSPSSHGVCVKCCAELKKGASLGALPVIDGSAPEILDINISGDGDKERRRRRRSLIKSRRVQTDLSMSLSTESIDEALSPRMSSQESLNNSFRLNSNPNILASVSECVLTRSIGVDPISMSVFSVSSSVVTRTKGTNTTENVRVVPESKSVKTNTLASTNRDSSTMTVPNCRTMDTQTADKILASKLIGTDYTGQRNKRTSTPIVVTMESGTCMPSITQEHKVTWTDAVQTTERSICTDGWEMVEAETETVSPVLCDKGIGARPEMKTVEINTDPVNIVDGATGEKEKKSKSKEKKEKDKDKTGDKKDKEKKKKERKEKKKYKDSCTETDPVIRADKETGTGRVQVKEAGTATTSPQMVNTGITPNRPATREISTVTDAVSLMDQGTHTDVRLYQDTATETFVAVCDGETVTEKIGVHDAETSVDVFSENVETLTETCHVVEKGCATDEDWYGDADVIVATCDVCNETRAFVDTATSPIDVGNSDSNTFKFEKVHNQTQTSPIKCLNKLISTSFDLDDESDGFKGLTCSDAATSTENLPYIGLLSDTDCDELILVPEVAIDVIGSDLEYERLMRESFPVPVSEASAQTIISSASLNIDAIVASEAEYGINMIKPSSDKLVTIGVNTDHKLTFEKETSTPTHHYISRSTTTTPNEKIDKSTSTESYVRAMQDALMSPASERSSKFYKIPKKDASVETDSTLLDEKMIACINKLKTVSERLNSPVSRSPPEGVPWNSKKQEETTTSPEELIKELEKISEVDRKKTVMDLVAKSSQVVARPKEPKADTAAVVKRKAQPITTLKAKYPEKVDKSTTETENKVIPQNATKSDISDQASAAKVSSRNGNGNGVTSPSPVQKRAPANSARNKSAPGRIATVPNPIPRKGSPKTVPITSPKPNRSTTQSATLPPSKQEVTGPDFYSTVPKTRHPKHGLQSISESRPSSVASEVSTTSYKSGASDHGSTSSNDILDFSSLKITVPPRAPSVSPTPQRHALKPSTTSASTNSKSAPSPGADSRKPRTPSKTKMEVIPTIEVEPDTRNRTGSTSSDQTDLEPSTEKKGLMKKLFGSKKKKSTEKRNASPSKSPKPGRKALETPPSQPEVQEASKEKPKEKPKPFVYMRSRIFSIEQKDEEKYNKPIVNKYCINEDEKPPVFDFSTSFTKKK